MKTKKKNEDFRLFIKSRMCLMGLTRTDLATYMHISSSTLYTRLCNPDELTVANLRVLSEKLKVDKLALLDAIKC